MHPFNLDGGGSGGSALVCSSNFVSSYGTITYVSNQPIPGVPTITCTGGVAPYNYTISAGNLGLVLSPSTGMIWGPILPSTATITSSFYTITGTDSSGSVGTFSFSIGIASGKLVEWLLKLVLYILFVNQKPSFYCFRSMF